MRYTIIFLCLFGCAPNTYENCYIIGNKRDNGGHITRIIENCNGVIRVLKIEKCITDTECERFN